MMLIAAKKNPAQKNGFTLIEILIALFIFAVIAIITATGLSAILKSHERSDVQMQEITQIQLALIIMKRDISQATARPIMDNNGNQIPAFLERAGYFELTRSGYSNPLMNNKRSTLQRVAYFYRDHQLIRRTWPVLDRAPDTPFSDKILLDGLKTLTFSYLADNKQFYPTWSASMLDKNQQHLLPAGIKVDFYFKKSGHLRYLFLIPAKGSD